MTHKDIAYCVSSDCENKCGRHISNCDAEPRELVSGIKHNGISVSVQKWDSHKLPVLCVQIENENRIYKVASFNSIETAEWFTELMFEFFEGLVKGEQQ